MLISFDIGIKNLSYCILEKSEGTTKIYDWNIIDLTGENKERKIIKCSECKKRAVFTFKNENFYCKSHAINSSYKVVSNDYYKFVKSKNPSKKTIINVIKKLDLDLDLSNIYTREDIYNFVQENYLLNICECDVGNKCKANDIDLITIGCSLSKKLSTVLPFDKLTTVIIENQISPIASRMKTIQGMLAQFFIDKGITNIKFISSLNKLKNFNLKKLNYTERKKASISITRDILEKNTITNTNTDINTKWLHFFNEHKKKDDLSDSLLQGIWFLGIYT